MITLLKRSLGFCMVGLGMLVSLGLMAGCALGPVETDPVKAAERAAAMATDCYARGGTWSDSARTCVGADVRR